MKIAQTKIIRQKGVYLNVKAGTGSAFKRLVCFFAGLFAAVCLAFGAGQATNLQDPNTAQMRRNDLIIAEMPTTSIERQLWQARISVSKEKKTSRSQEELQRLIQQLGAMNIKPRVSDPQPKTAAEPIAETEPNQMVQNAAESQKPAVDTIETKTSDGCISEQTLQVLSKQLEQPDSLTNPLGVADTLFKSGRMKEATVCYQEAFKRLGAEGADPFGNKAWILLQLGNCLRQENPEAALEKYNAVVVECSNSVWADLAKAQSDFINWQLKDKPKTFVKEMKL